MNAAWEVLMDPDNSIDGAATAIMAKLDILGVSGSAQLAYLDEDDTKDLMALLKLIPHRQFASKLEAANATATATTAVPAVPAPTAPATKRSATIPASTANNSTESPYATMKVMDLISLIEQRKLDRTGLSEKRELVSLLESHHYYSSSTPRPSSSPSSSSAGGGGSTTSSASGQGDPHANKKARQQQYKPIQHNIPKQSFKPLHDYVNEVVKAINSDDCMKFDYNPTDLKLNDIVYKPSDKPAPPSERTWGIATGNVIMFRVVAKKIKKQSRDSDYPYQEYDYTLKNERTQEEIQSVSSEDVVNNWSKVPPIGIRDLRKRFQSKTIDQGVWQTHANDPLRDLVNTCIDELASNEPIDLHPGTNEIVRDLVHPSLYPLIIDDSSNISSTGAKSSAPAPRSESRSRSIFMEESTKKNFWNRRCENSRFQWLPTEVAIDKSNVARFVSPINNLDTDKYPKVKSALEQVFTALLPGFERVWEYARYLSFDERNSQSEAQYPEVKPLSFKNSGLQAVVKIADYVFKPKAKFSGVWHYEGMAHENIVMTGIFYPHSDERLEGGGLEFKRQFTEVEARELIGEVPQTRPDWFDEIIDEGFVPMGKVTTETSKLMVFPNSHAHRVLEIVNNSSSETLHRRLVVFFIIDPSSRIASSRDFPPMPRRISLEQAMADRLELMQERKQAKQELNPRRVELCEH